jgi:hypothetical protein
MVTFACEWRDVAARHTALTCVSRSVVGIDRVSLVVPCPLQINGHLAWFASTWLGGRR